MEGAAGYTSRYVPVQRSLLLSCLHLLIARCAHCSDTTSAGCRGGLSSRPRQDHLQIHIDPGTKFDYDSQLAALRGDVAKVKQVRLWVFQPVLLQRCPSQTTFQQALAAR